MPAIFSRLFSIRPVTVRLGATVQGILLLALLSGFAGMVSACGSAVVSMSRTSRAFTADDYEGIYERWTRKSDEFSFSRLAEVGHATVTFESWEFRWAYVTRFARDHALDTAERSRLLEQSLEDSATRHRFFVTFGSPIFREAELGSERSDWRVVLVDDSGRHTVPVEMTRIPRPSRDVRTYFPSVNKQRHAFRLSFPTTHEDGTPVIADGSQYVILRFAGVGGQFDLKWDFQQENNAVNTQPMQTSGNESQ